MSGPVADFYLGIQIISIIETRYQHSFNQYGYHCIALNNSYRDLIWILLSSFLSLCCVEETLDFDVKGVRQVKPRILISDWPEAKYLRQVRRAKQKVSH